MSWVFCTSGAAIVKAGLNANATIIADATNLALWSDEVEDIVCGLAQKDLITAYPSITKNGKKVLGSYCSAHIAQKIRNYDLQVEPSRTSETVLDVLQADIVRAEKMITNKDFISYLGVA